MANNVFVILHRGKDRAQEEMSHINHSFGDGPLVVFSDLLSFPVANVWVALV
jgi:hypothetical protein